MQSETSDLRLHIYLAAGLTCALLGGAIGFAAGYGIRSTDSIRPVAPPSVAPPVSPAGHSTPPKVEDPVPTWDVSESKSPVDDSPTVALSIASSKTSYNRFGSKSESRLIIRCREKDTELFIALDEFLGTQSSKVIYRLDSQPSRTTFWSHSTDGKAVFASTPIVLARQLSQANTFFVRVSDFQGSQRDVEFNVAGLAQILPKVSTACKWQS